MPVSLRPAEPDDADGLGLVHVRTWQHAYRGILADDMLDGLDPVSRAAGWRARLDDPSNVPRTVVADDAGRVVGFATVCPSRDDDATDRVGELASIYVAPDASGRGIGRLLITDAVERLREGGWATATLWVLAENAAAIGFYERMGWTADGTTKRDTFGEHVVVEARYRLSLSAATDGRSVSSAD